MGERDRHTFPYMLLKYAYLLYSNYSETLVICHVF